MKKKNLFRAAKIAAAMANPAGALMRKSAFFNGDPVVIDPDAAGEALANSMPAADVLPASAAESSDNVVEAAEKIAAIEQMPVSERVQIFRLTPLFLWNAKLYEEPVMSTILANNLDFNVQNLMVKYPFKGQTITAYGKDRETTGEMAGWLHITIDASKLGPLPAGEGPVVIPFFTFQIVASNLNAAGGSRYSIFTHGNLENGRTLSDEEAKKYIFSFARKETTKEVYGLYIPFTVIATRTLPVLPIVDDSGVEAQYTQDNPPVVVPGTEPRTYHVWIKGLTDDEVFSMTIMGYGMRELRESCQLMSLPSGLAQ